VRSFRVTIGDRSVDSPLAKVTVEAHQYEKSWVMNVDDEDTIAKTVEAEFRTFLRDGWLHD
jgi:hypothetical protein